MQAAIVALRKRAQTAEALAGMTRTALLGVIKTALERSQNGLIVRERSWYQWIKKDGKVYPLASFIHFGEVSGLGEIYEGIGHSWGLPFDNFLIDTQREFSLAISLEPEDVELWEVPGSEAEAEDRRQWKLLADGSIIEFPSFEALLNSPDKGVEETSIADSLKWLKSAGMIHPDRLAKTAKLHRHVLGLAITGGLIPASTNLSIFGSCD